MNAAIIVITATTVINLITGMLALNINGGNAFKHTNNKKMENAITIDIFVNDGNIRLACANKFEPGAKIQQPDNGLGYELIKKRLELVYKGKHSLRVNNNGELYTIDLMVPLWIN